MSIQIAFTIVSVLTAVVVAIATLSFNKWSRGRYHPNPIIRDVDFAPRWSRDQELEIEFTVSILNPGIIPLYVEAIGVGFPKGGYGFGQLQEQETHRIEPGDCGSVKSTLKRLSPETVNEASIVCVLVVFSVGTRGGELLVAHRFDVEVREDPQFIGVSRIATLLPSASRFRTFSTTYPTSSLGWSFRRVVSWLNRTPRRRFLTKCSGKSLRKIRKGFRKLAETPITRFDWDTKE